MSMTKKVQFLGARLMVGVSSKTGNPYEMINMSYIVPAEANMGKLMSRYDVIGWEAKEKSISVATFESMEKADIPHLSWVEVEIGIDPENDERTIFSSVKLASSQPKTAGTASKTASTPIKN